MSIIKHTALVAVSAQQMYDLVNSIEDYPQFLPYCKSTVVKERTDEYVIASITVAKKPFYKTFTTRNTLMPPNEMVLELLDGPFERLKGSWQFIALEETACKVNFSLDFAFKNKLTELLAQPLVDYISNTMVNAFIKRAQAIK